MSSVTQFCKTGNKIYLSGLDYTKIAIYLYYANKKLGQLYKSNERLDTKEYNLCMEIVYYFNIYNNRYLKYIATNKPVIGNEYILSQYKFNTCYECSLNDLYKELVKLADKIDKYVGKYILLLNVNLIYDNESKFNPATYEFHIFHLVYNLLKNKPIFIIGNKTDLDNTIKHLSISSEIDFLLYISELPIDLEDESIDLFMNNINKSINKKIKFGQFELFEKGCNPIPFEIPSYKKVKYPDYLFDIEEETPLPSPVSLSLEPDIDLGYKADSIDSVD